MRPPCQTEYVDAVHLWPHPTTTLVIVTLHSSDFVFKSVNCKPLIS